MPMHAHFVDVPVQITGVGACACTSMLSLYQFCRHVLFCALACLWGKVSSMLTSISSSSLSASMPNMQQARNVSVGLTRSNCSGSGGQGNLQEPRLSRRNGTWPLHLAVRNTFWLSVKMLAFSAALLQKLYHAFVGELHAKSTSLETRRSLFLTPSLPVTNPNLDLSEFDVFKMTTWMK